MKFSTAFSLQIISGEFVGIIGPNGAGKTTLLTIVNGLGKLVSGSVQVLGKPVTNNDRHELRKQVGYVAQAANIDPRMPMSVREVAMIGRYGILGLFHRPGKKDWNIVDEALEMVGMSHLANRPIGHLSAASSSAPRSPAAWRRNRKSSCWMSRLPHWTGKRARIFWNWFAEFTTPGI